VLRLHSLLCFLALAAGLAASTPPCAAQVVPVPPPADTLRAPAETLRPSPIPLPADTLAEPSRQARVGLTDAVEPAPPATEPGRLEHPVTFAARDSLVIVFREGEDPAGDVGTLYGEARTSYDTATLTAAEIDLLFGLETLRARGLPGDTAEAGRPAGSSGARRRSRGANWRSTSPRGAAASSGRGPRCRTGTSLGGWSSRPGRG
jgi:hypothetical protein